MVKIVIVNTVEYVMKTTFAIALELVIMDQIVN